MKNFGITFLIWFLAILTAFPVMAQTGQVARKKNLFGNYIYLQEGQHLQESQRMSEKEFLHKMQDNLEAYELMRNARRNRMWGGILGGASGLLIGSQLDLNNSGKKDNREVLFAGVALFAGSIPLEIIYAKRSERAMHLYNSGLPESSTGFKSEFHLGFTGSGIGLQLRF